MRFTGYAYRALNKNKGARLLSMEGLNPAPGNHDLAASQIWKNWFWNTQSGGPVTHNDQITIGLSVSTSNSVVSTINVNNTISVVSSSSQSQPVAENKKTVSSLSSVNQSQTTGSQIQSIFSYLSQLNQNESGSQISQLSENKNTVSQFQTAPTSSDAINLLSVLRFISTASNILAENIMSNAGSAIAYLSNFNSSVSQKNIASVQSLFTAYSQPSPFITQTFGCDFTSNISYVSRINSVQSDLQTGLISGIIKYKNQVISQLSNSVNNNIGSHCTYKHNFVYSASSISASNLTEYASGQTVTMNKKIVFIF